jgi:hypothetical protein
VNQTVTIQSPEVSSALRKIRTQWIALYGMQIVTGTFVAFQGLDRLPNTYDPFTVKFLLWALLGAFVAQWAWFTMRGLREQKGFPSTTAEVPLQLVTDYKNTTKIFIALCFMELAVFATLTHRP